MVALIPSATIRAAYCSLSPRANVWRRSSEPLKDLIDLLNLL
jgi:hypothetical protein